MDPDNKILFVILTNVIILLKLTFKIYIDLLYFFDKKVLITIKLTGSRTENY